MATQRTDLMKMAVVALVSVILGGGASFAAFGRDAITKDDLRELSPWVKERGEVRSLIQRNAEDVRNLLDDVAALVKAQGEHLAEVKVLCAKVDMLLETKR